MLNGNKSRKYLQLENGNTEARHSKQKENTSGKVNLQENVRWKSFSLFMWIRKNNPPSWTKSARANKLESRGRKQISKLTMAETSYFCRKGRGYWEHWNHRTIQLKFSYLYVCLDVLWRPQNSICCCCFSLNYCNWQYQDNHFLLNKTKAGIRIKCLLIMSMWY